jgi:hypothetical protein
MAHRYQGTTCSAKIAIDPNLRKCAHSDSHRSAALYQGTTLVGPYRGSRRGLQPLRSVFAAMRAQLSHLGRLRRTLPPKGRIGRLRRTLPPKGRIGRLRRTLPPKGRIGRLRRTLPPAAQRSNQTADRDLTLSGHPWRKRSTDDVAAETAHAKELQSTLVRTWGTPSDSYSVSATRTKVVTR